jgi:hypothetical protein
MQSLIQTGLIILLINVISYDLLSSWLLTRYFQISPNNFVISKCNLSESFNTVSRSEVKRVLNTVNRNSAVGSDQIMYTTLSYLDECSLDTLPSLTTALLKSGHDYYTWKHSICIIMPRQGKSSYNIAKSDRLISLLHALEK